MCSEYNETNLCQNIIHFMAFEDFKIIIGDAYTIIVISVNIFLTYIKIILIYLHERILHNTKTNNS